MRHMMTFQEKLRENWKGKEMYDKTTFGFQMSWRLAYLGFSFLVTNLGV
jgi:hypothetical protein